MPPILDHMAFKIDFGIHFIVQNIPFFPFILHFYCISSDFSDLPDMTDESELSVLR